MRAGLAISCERSSVWCPSAVIGKPVSRSGQIRSQKERVQTKHLLLFIESREVRWTWRRKSFGSKEFSGSLLNIASACCSRETNDGGTAEAGVQMLAAEAWPVLFRSLCR